MKTIFDAETGELLGAHMVGALVTEQIDGFGIARHLEATDESLLSMIFAIRHFPKRCMNPYSRPAINRCINKK